MTLSLLHVLSCKTSIIHVNQTVLIVKLRIRNRVNFIILYVFYNSTLG